MRIDAIAIGNNPPEDVNVIIEVPHNNPPEDVNVIIEVPHGGQPIKYEMDKEAGTLVVDRFLHTPMSYPGNYGFVPHTLSEDGDPIDVLVANSRELVPGCLINVRPIGVLVMEDNAHFFEHYKDLEPGKWVRIGDWHGSEDAKRMIVEAIERAK
jgi:inorganic pyrophosphatase